MKAFFQRIAALLLGMTLTSACGIFSPAPTPTPTQDSALVLTQAFATFQAAYTATAARWTLTPSQTPTPTRTNTPTATFTPTITPTFTPNFPSATPTITPFTLACNVAAYVGDPTVPPGTVFTTGSIITKTWELQNLGKCSWTTSYGLVFDHGDALTETTDLKLPRSVSPGKTSTVSLELTAPSEPGTYQGYWLLRDAKGVRFGTGPGANQPIWVQITIVDPTPRHGLDFALAHCAAEWFTGSGELACPSPIGSSSGYVQTVNEAHFENRIEDELTLLTHPNNSSSGWISGRYPRYTVKPGDRFLAWVGCLHDSEDCEVVFKLQYQVWDEDPVTVQEWPQVYDGAVTEIDLDLSSLAGQDIRFILTVEVEGGQSSEANAFWFLPRIESPSE